MQEKKIVLITNIPTPYRIPLFNELNDQLKEKNIKMKVIYGALSYPRRKWKINMSECKHDYEVLPSFIIKLKGQGKYIFTYKGLLKLINRENPSIIIE